jgi:hypothetical protein
MSKLELNADDSGSNATVLQCTGNMSLLGSAHEGLRRMRNWGVLHNVKLHGRVTPLRKDLEL